MDMRFPDLGWMVKEKSLALNKSAIFEESLSSPEKPQMTTAPHRSTLQFIAEVQWQIDARRSPGARIAGEPQESLGHHGDSQMFMHKFRVDVDRLAYQRSEDLLPYGSPLMAYEPAMRLHSSRQPGLSYEIGPGTFAVRATRPVDWTDFSSALREGLKVVMAARDYSAREQPFSYIRMHVVEAFMAPWSHQQDMADFLKDALGIQVVLPEGIARHLRPGYRYRPLLQLQLYTDHQRELKVAVDVGYVEDDLAYLLDTTVSTENRELLTLDQVVQAIDESYVIRQGMFGDIPLPSSP
jgi:hypothetical protein